MDDTYDSVKARVFATGGIPDGYFGDRRPVGFALLTTGQVVAVADCGYVNCLDGLVTDEPEAIWMLQNHPSARLVDLDPGIAPLTWKPPRRRRYHIAAVARMRWHVVHTASGLLVSSVGPLGRISKADCAKLATALDALAPHGDPDAATNRLLRIGWPPSWRNVIDPTYEYTADDAIRDMTAQASEADANGAR